MLASYFSLSQSWPRLATYQSKGSYTLKLVISFFTLKKSHNLQTHFIKDWNLLTDDISSSGKFFLSHFLISFQTPTFLLLIIRKKNLETNFYLQSMLQTFPSNGMFPTITAQCYCIINVLLETFTGTDSSMLSDCWGSLTNTRKSLFKSIKSTLRWTDAIFCKPELNQVSHDQF